MARATPKPPARLDVVNMQVVEAGTILHRTHARALRPAQFNPCLGQPTRFAPIRDAANACIPSLYAATTCEAAAFESIFHDIDARSRFKTVRLETVRERNVCRITPTHDLRLARLFAPDLKNWGIERADLIETPRSRYPHTALWAAAIHAAAPDLHGMVWTSRRCDPELCVLLFGDRIAESAFEVISCRHVATDSELFLELRGYGRRAGIDIVA